MRPARCLARLLLMPRHRDRRKKTKVQIWKKRVFFFYRYFLGIMVVTSSRLELRGNSVTSLVRWFRAPGPGEGRSSFRLWLLLLGRRCLQQPISGLEKSPLHSSKTLCAPKTFRSASAVAHLVSAKEPRTRLSPSREKDTAWLLLKAHRLQMA